MGLPDGYQEKNHLLIHASSLNHLIMKKTTRFTALTQQLLQLPWVGRRVMAAL
jgi:hypothetical protein